MSVPALPIVIRFAKGTGTFRLVINDSRLGTRQRVEVRVHDALGDVSWRPADGGSAPDVEDILTAAIRTVFAAGCTVAVRNGDESAAVTRDIDIGEWPKR